MLDDSTVALTNGASSHMDATNALTVDEIAALFGIPVTAVQERLARRAVPQEYFSIADLAKRWRCSRGTVYNRLRAHGAKVLDFAPLCSEAGFPLHRIAPGIQAPAFDFSSYLRSAYVSQLHEQGALDLAELDSRLHGSVESAKDYLREHFKERTKEKSKNLVEEWKSERVYPYTEEPSNIVQVVERQVFDIVALNVATSLPDFQSQDQRNRKFQLRMLRQAIERSPKELQLILGEVLG